MAEPLEIGEGIKIPEDELLIRASRPSGPGGQHANVTASRVEVNFDIANSPSLPGWARERLLQRLGPRASAVAQEARSQLRNRMLARERLAKRLAGALQRPKERRPTRPGAAARERRLEAKRRTAKRKQMRQPPGDE